MKSTPHVSVHEAPGYVRYTLYVFGDGFHERPMVGDNFHCSSIGCPMIYGRFKGHVTKDCLR